MSLSDAAEQDLALLIFNNVTWAGVGDSTGIVGSGSAGDYYISLHTADPGETGTQTTNEANYTGYGRIAVVRSSAGFTVSGTTIVQNTAAINFAPCTGGSNVITYFAIGKSSSGAGEIVVSGALSSSLPVSNGITPAFAINALTVTLD
jgi:hypothetical protein